jgi:hypothetical protein
LGLKLVENAVRKGTATLEHIRSLKGSFFRNEKGRYILKRSRFDLFEREGQAAESA